MKEPMLRKPALSKTSFKMPEVEVISKADHKELCYLLVDLVKAAHIEHINTTNYARHMALDELYSDLPGEIDAYLEMVVLHYGEVQLLDSPRVFDTHFNLVISKVEELLDDCEIGAIETVLGDIQKFLVGIKYKLERLK
ncbi:hypothetical protein [Vibrio phage vB_VpaP_SJSY21]|nr:hypothetical protein [Vibrio phage vB_VpaP_SJSY21]